MIFRNTKEMKMHCVGRINFLVVSKSVTAKVNKAEIELPASLRWHYSTQLLTIYVKQKKVLKK